MTATAACEWALSGDCHCTAPRPALHLPAPVCPIPSSLRRLLCTRCISDAFPTAFNSFYSFQAFSFLLCL
jgi:hypothetical protein